MKLLKNILVILILVFIIFSCKKDTVESTEDNDYIFTAPISKEKLPDDLIWLTNDTDPEFASPEAKKGGTINSFLLSFPNTFRMVGPDNNNSFANYIAENRLSLVELHPNTENLIPELATRWAYGDDNMTMYYKLNKNARWSDGKPVTAHDFAYTLEFHRAKEIVDPYYNDVYSEEKFEVIVYDDYTIAVINKDSKVIKSDLFYHTNISPTPRHFYGKLDEDFISKYNWKIEPNTGAYQITDFKKGKYIVFERVNDWWAKDLKYFKNRFNVDKIIFKVIKDQNLTWEYFKKGKIDVHGATHPLYWYDKCDIDIFKDGYTNKIWFFNDTKQSPWGMYLNQDTELFKDKNLRYAFAHAMNFDLVNKKILRNEYYRLEHAYVGYGKYSNNNIRARMFDIDKVEEYMKKSGWSRGNDGIWQKNGSRFSVDILYYADLNTQRLIILKEEAQKAGIELKLEKVDPSVLYKKVIEKKHVITMWQWGTRFRPVYFQQYLSEYSHKPQTNNITNTDNKELDKLINKYRYSFSENEKITLSHKIQEMLHEECSFIPWYMIPYVRQVYWRWIKLPNVPGTKNTDNVFDLFSPSTGGLFWYDEKLHKETLKAMKKGIKFEPVTIIDKTYMMDIIKKQEGNKK